MTKKKYIVKQSPVHGRGLFATEDLKKGELLGCLETKPTSKDGAYVLWVSEDEGHRVLCDFRFINHGSNPNVAYNDDLTVTVLRNVKAGEELLHHYGDEWE